MPEKTFDVVTWGETMIRLSPPLGTALESTHGLDVMVGGAESNMATGLARLGKRVGWVSRLPDNPLGHRIAREIGGHGVDISHVLWALSTEKTGLFFLETGTLPRPNLVIYDRAGSAIARLDPHELDYAYLSSGRVLFLTGITPALSPSCRKAWLQSAAEARTGGCRVVLDVNYRAKLWTPDQARATLETVFPHTDVLIAGIGDLRKLFDAPLDAQRAAETMAAAYGLPLVVVTLGAQGALAYEDGRYEQHPAFDTDIVDRVGAGDAFAAGFLYGWRERDVAYGLRCGNALAALKQTYRGDGTWSSLGDLLKLVESPVIDPRGIER